MESQAWANHPQGWPKQIVGDGPALPLRWASAPAYGARQKNSSFHSRRTCLLWHCLDTRTQIPTG